MGEPDARAHVDVEAPAEEVYRLISDLPGMATLAEEFEAGTWLGGETAARPGARFKGVNSRGAKRWSTVSTVTDARPDCFAFHVRGMGLPIARWRYDIEATDTGCRVTESAWDIRLTPLRPLGRLITGVADRRTAIQGNIERTLERLKQAVEATATA